MKTTPFRKNFANNLKEGYSFCRMRPMPDGAHSTQIWGTLETNAEIHAFPYKYNVPLST